MTENPQTPEGQPGDRPRGADDQAAAPTSNPASAQPAVPTTSASDIAPRAASTAQPSVGTAAQDQTHQPAAVATHPAQDGAAFGPAAQEQTHQTAAQPAPAKRSLALPVIAALVVGAVLGGGSGAGIYALIDANSSSGNVTTAVAAPNVTVNRAEDATTVTAVAAKASPSVVTISVQGGNAAGTGSGVILSEDGYVLTNTHVVTLDGATADAEVQVTTNDGRIFSATIVGTDPTVDLAVIKLDDASGLTPIEFADSDDLNVGDTAIAIGAPLGLAGTVTDGIVSSLNRSIEVASSAAPEQDDTDSGDQGRGDDGQFPFYFDFGDPDEQQQGQASTSSTISLPVIQTDAAINPGNSGGALLDSTGALIGLNVAIASTGSGTSGQSGNIGVGFAIPSNLAKRVADEIIANGSASHGLLGASVSDPAQQSPAAKIAGAYVAEVVSGGAAADAGLQEGDIVTQFNGVAITSPSDLTAQVRYLAAGSEAVLLYVRDGETRQATVTLGTLEQ